MARFYLDENLTEQLVTLLLALGHDAVSTNALGRKGIRDHQQLLFAANEQRILITFNIADFVLLHEAWRDWSAAWGTSPDVARHAGILAIRQDKSGLSVRQLAAGDRLARSKVGDATCRRAGCTALRKSA